MTSLARFTSQIGRSPGPDLSACNGANIAGDADGHSNVPRRLASSGSRGRVPLTNAPKRPMLDNRSSVPKTRGYFWPRIICTSPSSPCIYKGPHPFRGDVDFSAYF